MTEQKSNAGRKELYTSMIQPYLSDISKYKKSGYTESEIAQKLGVSYSAFNKYKQKHEELTQALKVGNEELVVELENTLFRRALGFEHEEVRTVVEERGGRQFKRIEKHRKFYPPSDTAIIFALKKLKPEKYGDEIKVNMEQQVVIIDDMDGV